MNSRAIFILGMHRSGTSMVSGLLRTLGVDLGADAELMNSAPDNPKGFFEHVALYEINVEILARLGGDWWQVPEFPAGWEASSAMADLADRARRIVERSFGRSPLWGFKDPRLCFTVPFWRRVVGCPISCVLAIRNPLDVAKSLQARNGFPIYQGAELWRRYTVSSIAGSSGLGRLPVLYEDFLTNFESELGRLAGFCGLADWKGAFGAARAFAEQGMRHQRSSVQETEEHPDLPDEIKRLYRTIRVNAGSLRPRDRAAEEALDLLVRAHAAGP